EAKKIEIEGEGAYEGLRLQLNDLISVKADDNYVEVTYVVDGKLKKQLIRNTLKNVEAMVPELLRTHRSYLINPEHFQQFKTENGKLFLQLAYELVIPVTKTYTKEVKARF
ncbi:MAG: LytTR family DNA-binding domain-containing protein, partial [Marinirhabdus sp.]|nr:LytTR family DNA-binding domain-containing protein [Marinirhabdus sp.]